MGEEWVVQASAESENGFDPIDILDIVYFLLFRLPCSDFIEN